MPEPSSSMPTTTEAPGARLRPWQLAGSCALALGVWFGGLLVGALAFEPTAAVMVVAPGGRAVIASAESADVDLLEASGALFTVSGRHAGFVRRLYSAGAWLVLPSMSGGCRIRLPIRAPQIS